MEVKICDNREEWKKGIIQANQTLQLGSERAEFLQSFEWGEFQKNTGKKVIRLQLVENGEVAGQIQGFEHKLGLGMKYLYVPRFKTSDIGLESAVDYCKKNNYIFLRVEPLDKISYVLGLTSYVRNRQPQTSLVLDLTKSEEELLSGMHSKTRYNIHLAEKHEVEVRLEKNIEVFWQLNLETIGRDKFKSHDKNYYAKMLELPICYQLTAYYKNKPIASNILIVNDNTIVYLHGSSSTEFRNLMAPYLLQWEGIKLGKSLNCNYYDFWGVAPMISDNDRKPHSCFNNFCWEVNHSWSGVTRFKVGFGGKVIQYPEACDIILKSGYYRLYNLIRRIKRLK